MEMAKTINRPDCWERLAQQALKQGNHKVCLIDHSNKTGNLTDFEC